MTQGVIPPARRRIVMIVDNYVDGDSRVRKTAMAAADAGYDVVLIGRSPSGQREESTLGAATLIRLPQPLALLSYWNRNPGRSLRWPLAFPYRDAAMHKRRRLDLAQRNLRDVTAQINRDIAEHGSSPLTRKLVRRWLKATLAFRYAWYGVRMFEYRRATDHHKNAHGPIDAIKPRIWRFARGKDAWRRLDPLLSDYEIVYGPEIDRLQPELIHAHDFRMVGVATRAAVRAAGMGRECRVVYDAHEFLPGVRAHSSRWLIANEAHEAKYAPRADAVVTVSPRLAEMLQERHSLRETPTVVLNAPSLADAKTVVDDGLSIRAACGLSSDIPLLVYSGSPAEQRGLATVVEALPQLPGVHVALVVPGRPAAIEELLERAAELEVTDRLHLHDYVPHDQVVAFLSSADIGLVPILHQPNHEIALITKYFEYAHARLPIVVSDVETMARTTKELGNGEVFTAGDVTGLTTAVHAVLNDKVKYRQAYDEPGLLEQWSWETQAGILLALYARLLGSTPNTGRAAA